MAFNRNKSEGGNQMSLESGLVKTFVSDSSFNKATIISSFLFSILIIIVYIIKVKFSISETDIQCICQITAGLCGLTLAVPLFLKDFDKTSKFWKQFYLITFTFFFTTFIGVLSFLQTNSSEINDIKLYIWILISVTISLNISNIPFNKKINKMSYEFEISFNTILDFAISYIILLISLFFVKENFLLYGTILFTIYGFYLTTSMMLSILIELFLGKQKQLDNKRRIKFAIQNVVLNNKHIGINEQTLIDKLKSEEFPNEKEVISRSNVQELVAQMDSETSIDEPKITIYNRDIIIPRWSNTIEVSLKYTKTEYIFIFSGNRKGDYSNYLMNYIGDDNKNKFYEFLSKESGLSIELLKENNGLLIKYSPIKSFKIRKIDQSMSSFHYKYYKEYYFIVIKNNFLNDVNIDINTSILSPMEVEYTLQLFNSEKARYFFDGRENFDLITELKTFSNHNIV